MAGAELTKGRVDQFPILDKDDLSADRKEMQSSMLYLSNGVFDSQQSVQSTLLKGASTEGYNCMRDHSRQMDFLEEANARQFIELLNDMEVFSNTL